MITGLFSQSPDYDYQNFDSFLSRNLSILILFNFFKKKRKKSNGYMKRGGKTLLLSNGV